MHMLRFENILYKYSTFDLPLYPVCNLVRNFTVNMKYSMPFVHQYLDLSWGFSR